MAKKVTKSKPAAKKAPAKPAKKAVAKKPLTKKAPVKKSAPKKNTAKKAAPKKVVKVAKKAAKPAPKKAAKPAKKSVKPVAKKVVKPAVKAVKSAPKKVVKPIAKKVVAKPVKKAATAPVAKAKPASAPKAEPKAITPVVEVKKAAKPEKIVKFPKLHNAIKKSKEMEADEVKPIPVVEKPKKEIVVKNTDMRSRYSDEELNEFKEIILKKLEEARKDYEILKDTLSHKDDHGTDDTSPTFKLLEDGSDVMSKEETAQLAARQQKFIENLENALIRIENKTYGICRVTGRLISKERLRSVPHATLSIEAKMEMNTGN